jgi:hypothetical protein
VGLPARTGAAKALLSQNCGARVLRGFVERIPEQCFAARALLAIQLTVVKVHRIQRYLRLNIFNPPIGRNDRLIFIYNQIIFPVACLLLTGMSIKNQIIDNAGYARRQ